MRQHQTEQDEKTQRTTTERLAAQQAATRRTTAPRDTPQHTTGRRNQEPLGPTRRQHRTDWPNSKQATTTGNNTQHQAAPQGQESTAQSATTQAHQHSTGQAEHRNRNSLENHGEARNNDKKTSRECSRARQQSTTKTAQLDPAQHGAEQHGVRSQPDTSTPHNTAHNTKHTTERSNTQHDAQQNTTQDTTTGQGGRALPAHTRQKKTTCKAPEKGGAGNTTRHPPKAARGRAAPPAWRHWAPAAQQVTTQKEEARAGSTGRQSESANRPSPKHKAQINTQQHAPQPRTHQPSSSQPAHYGTEKGKKKKERTEAERKKKPKQQKKTGRKKNTQGGRNKKRKKTKEVGGHKIPRPKAPRAGKDGTPETREAHKRNVKKTKGRNSQEQGNPSPGGGEQTKGAPGTSTGKGDAHQNAPGRPTRPTLPGKHAHTYTHGTRVWRPPTRKSRCQHPHKTAPVHRPSPPSKDGQHGKPDPSVTGSTHANHRSARSPRATPEGPARDNPIAGLRTGTTRSEPTAAAWAAPMGRHIEPGSRPTSRCPGQPPSKSRRASYRDGKRHHGVRTTDRTTESDRTGRGAEKLAAHQRGATRHAREACRWRQPRHKDRCQATTTTGCRKYGQRAQPLTNHGTGTGARRHPTHTPHAPAGSGGAQAERAHKHTDTSQHPSQEWRGAAKTGAQAHTLTPHTLARSGGVQAERTHKCTHTPTPQPGVAGHSLNLSPNTHTHTAHLSQEWRGTSRARTQTHTHPNTPARSRGAQPKSEPKHPHPHHTPEPGTAGYSGARTQTHTHPNNPARSGRPQPKPEPKSTHPHRTTQP